MIPLGMALLLSATSTFAVNLVGSGGQCETFQALRELRVFKDPTLFLPNVQEIQQDPKLGWEKLLKESPLHNSFKGPVRLARVGPVTEFKNFGAIARLYELVEPRLRLVDLDTGARLKVTRIIPVQVCDQGTLGFVLEEDLLRATLKEEFEGEGMPPSVYPNPIPDYQQRVLRGER